MAGFLINHNLVLYYLISRVPSLPILALVLVSIAHVKNIRHGDEGHSFQNEIMLITKGPLGHSYSALEYFRNILAVPNNLFSAGMLYSMRYSVFLIIHLASLLYSPIVPTILPYTSHLPNPFDFLFQVFKFLRFFFLFITSSIIFLAQHCQW